MFRWHGFVCAKGHYRCMEAACECVFVSMYVCLCVCSLFSMWLFVVCANVLCIRVGVCVWTPFSWNEAPRSFTHSCYPPTHTHTHIERTLNGALKWWAQGRSTAPNDDDIRRPLRFAPPSVSCWFIGCYAPLPPRYLTRDTSELRDVAVNNGNKVMNLHCLLENRNKLPAAYIHLEHCSYHIRDTALRHRRGIWTNRGISQTRYMYTGLPDHGPSADDRKYTCVSRWKFIRVNGIRLTPGYIHSDQCYPLSLLPGAVPAWSVCAGFCHLKCYCVPYSEALTELDNHGLCKHPVLLQPLMRPAVTHTWKPTRSSTALKGFHRRRGGAERGQEVLAFCCGIFLLKVWKSHSYTQVFSVTVAD